MDMGHYAPASEVLVDMAARGGDRGTFCARDQRISRVGTLLAGLSAVLASAPARADDLLQALARTYAGDPAIEEARAQQRALDEGVAITRAAGLPSLAASAKFIEAFDYQPVDLVDPVVFPRRTLTAEGTLSVPVYRGGSIRNTIRAAQTRVIAGRSDVAATQSNSFANAVAAYMDIIRDEAVVGLNQKNVGALEMNLQASSARFIHGELTKTDVAQSSERLNLARAVLQSAEVSLAVSREKYIRAIGSPPGALESPPALKGLPASADDAVAIALDNNPDLISIRKKAAAYGYDVKAAAGSRLPRLSLIADTTLNRYLGTYGAGYRTYPVGGGSTADLQSLYFRQHDRTSYVGATLSLPLFQGGLPAAQERLARAQEDAALEHANLVERQVIEVTRAAYATWRAADGIIAADQAAVEAAQQALTGVKAENKIGSRTIFDILYAEQELVNAQVQLVVAQHDAYVAAFNLLTAMGRTTPRDLGLDIAEPYDPEAHYRQYANSIWDWGMVPGAGARSTSTTQTAAQDGALKTP